MLSAGVGLFGCVLVGLIRAGMDFSADNRLYREYYMLFGRRFGRWQPLPVIVGVTLKYFSEVVTVNSGNNWKVWHNGPNRIGKLVVMLSVKNTATGIILSYFSLDDVNQASDFAHEIAEKFGVPVNIFLPTNQFRTL